MLFATRRRKGHLSLALLSALLLGAPGHIFAEETLAISDPGLFEKSILAALEARKAYGPYENDEEEARVNRIGYAIARHSGFRKFPFSFYLVDMALPNAFALPAGHIFVTRGMLDLDLSDDMLAGLLGHEVAHVSEEHFLSMRRRATLLGVLSQVLTVGLMVGASQSDSDTYVDGWGIRRDSGNTGALVQGAAATGMLVSELLLRSYSRQNEDESDDQGQRFAAAAGFDPDGTRQLMAKLEERLPQDQNFGYWQTHPFFTERVRAAKARKNTLVVQDPYPVEPYRQRSQAALLEFVKTPHSSPEIDEFLAETALAAWPRGDVADGLRLDRLQGSRKAVEEMRPLARDYGSLLTSYESELKTVFELTPQSAFLAQAQAEIAELQESRDDLYGDALAVLDGEVYETPFLETFLSNFPDSERSPEVALALGEAYARLSRETEAVESLLRARSSGTGDVADRARRGLVVLAPRLERLAALQTLTEQSHDPELAEVALGRLKGMASTFEELENGAEFLERDTGGPLAETVRQRQHLLADELHKEVILYQRMGDHGKAVQGIHRILTLAPLSPAAKSLGESALAETG